MCIEIFKEGFIINKIGNKKKMVIIYMSIYWEWYRVSCYIGENYKVIGIVKWKKLEKYVY